MMFNRKEYMNQYQINNKEKIKKCKSDYYIKNKEKIKIWSEQYYIKNREIILYQNNEHSKKYREKYPEKVRENQKQWRKDNPKYQNQWQSNKYKTDFKYNLNCKIVSAIGRALKGNKKGRKWETYVGYTIQDLTNHLIETLPEGYIWNDYLDGTLEIDHIIPISAFNYTKSEHPDFQRCWALNNLRLLPAKENRIKHNKIEKPFQPTLQLC